MSEFNQLMVVEGVIKPFFKEFLQRAESKGRLLEKNRAAADARAEAVIEWVWQQPAEMFTSEMAQSADITSTANDLIKLYMADKASK